METPLLDDNNPAIELSSRSLNPQNSGDNRPFEITAPTGEELCIDEEPKDKDLMDKDKKMSMFKTPYDQFIDPKTNYFDKKDPQNFIN